MDVGVHRGEDTMFYLKKGFRVVGIEANPALYEELQDRFRQYIVRGDLKLLNVAVAAQDGPVTFYRNLTKSDWGTIYPDRADRNQRLQAPSETVTVEGRRFEHILNEFGIPYYLKVDIEGADLLCVSALRQTKDKPKLLSFESTKTSWKGLCNELTLLSELGYRKFKVVSQKDVPSQTCPFPALEGSHTSHSFCLGASGAFGEEAPGKWVTAAEALRLYRTIYWTYRMFGDSGIFTRVNWQRPLIWRLRRYLPATLPVMDWYDTHAAL